MYKSIARRLEVKPRSLHCVQDVYSLKQEMKLTLHSCMIKTETTMILFERAVIRVLTAHTEWLPGVQLRHLVPSVQYIQRIVRVCGSVEEH